MSIKFYLNGALRAAEGIAPSVTVLDYLRDHLGMTGTKEGCAEGDCGACTVVLVEETENGRSFRAVNSCLLTLPQINGADVITVEGLAPDHEALDPVQESMANGDGTQCGFCTPGFIMSLYALRQSDESPSDAVIHDALAGNLCRCTGYRPIIEAAENSCGVAGNDSYQVPESLQPVESYQSAGQEFRAPRSVQALAEIFSQNPDAHLLAGGTDLGMLASKERISLPFVIHTAHVAELRQIEETDDYLELGAAVTYTEALPFIERLYPSFATLIHRIGSRQIRNVGTIGGNIGNASPIGDTPPCLIALDATITLCSTAGEREMAIEEFFLDYRKTDLKPGEFIKAIRIPKLSDSQFFRTYKISKRYDQDISSVIGAFRIDIQDGVVGQARVAYGGMAATPKRAKTCEASLSGADWTEENLSSAGAGIDNDYTPLDDHRASRDYRLMVARNLFTRLYRDLADTGEQLDVVML